MLTKAQLKRRIKKLAAYFYRWFLRNDNFSIISNNCWGGVIYDRYALQYLTPTIGLWIPPKDYVRFLGNIHYYLEKDVCKISWNESHVAELLRKRKDNGRYDFELDELIVGRIEDIDIIFIHYKSFEEARSKWNRRKTRINFDNLVVKFNDQNECTQEDFEEFCALPYKNKLFFTANPNWKDAPCSIFIEKYAKHGYVENDTTHGDVPLNISKYLNHIKNTQSGMEE